MNKYTFLFVVFVLDELILGFACDSVSELTLDLKKHVRITKKKTSKHVCKKAKTQSCLTRNKYYLVTCVFQIFLQFSDSVPLER